MTIYIVYFDSPHGVGISSVWSTRDAARKAAEELEEELDDEWGGVYIWSAQVQHDEKIPLDTEAEK